MEICTSLKRNGDSSCGCELQLDLFDVYFDGILFCFCSYAFEIFCHENNQLVNKIHNTI